jgi:putative FmdB family regulatory protein
MPLYEYVCQQCDCRYERLERASEPKDGTCPECGGTSRRLIGTPALQFKGSGWYVNDYGKGNGNGDGSRPTEKETDTATKAAESTPSPKPESKKTKKKADAKVA